VRGRVRGDDEVKRALAIVIALEAAAAASPLVTAPAGWKGGPSDDLMHATGLTPHFGGVHGIIEAERYDAPKPGVVLYVTRVAANTTAIASAAQAELANVEPSNIKAPKVEMTSADKAIIASLDWRDDKAGIKGTSKMVIAAVADRVVAVKGECLAAADADADLLAACGKALATLDPGIAPKDRVDLTSTSTSPTTSTSTSTSPELTLSTEPPHAKVPPLAVPPDNASPRTDVRPMILGAAILALAGVFYWNRKRRDRFAAENKGAADDS
jgi:hypothetical protein